MVAPKIAPGEHRRGATLFEMAIVVALIGAIASLHFEREQAAVRQQIVGKMAAELQRVLDAAMAYQLDHGEWPLDSCSAAAYAAGSLRDCNGDGDRQSDDINGVRRLVDSGYLHAGGIAIDDAGTRNLATARTLMGASLVMHPVQEIVPAAATDLGSGRSLYHTTAYWQSYLPGTLAATNSSPTLAPGLRVRYALPRSAGWSCYARELAHHIIGAKPIRLADPLLTPPAPTELSQEPQLPISLGNCRQLNAAGDADEAFAVEVLLRRWQESTATVMIPSIDGRLHVSGLRLGGSTGVPMWLEAAASGELRLRAAVRTASDLPTTDAMIQFAKADNHPTAPRGGIVTLRGVDEGHLGIMSGYVPGGGDAVRPTIDSVGSDHRHLSSLVFERPDGSHIGMLSGDLLGYDRFVSPDAAIFGGTAVTLSVGDAARASRHAGWRAELLHYPAGQVHGLDASHSLIQPDTTGLRLYNVVKFEYAGVRIYGGRMTIMPGNTFYAGFNSGAQRYFTMDSADNPPVSAETEAYQHPGEGVQVNRLTVYRDLVYDPPDTTLLSAGVVRPAGLGGSAKRVPLVGAGAPHDNYPANFIMRPATGIYLRTNGHRLTLDLVGKNLELHEASISLHGLDATRIDFAVTGADAPFEQSAATVQVLNGGIQDLRTLRCAGSATQCPTP